jgi:ATP-dependent RNA helicase DDX56/DBP9
MRNLATFLFVLKDVARSVTTRDVQDARRQDLKNEILNSEK